MLETTVHFLFIGTSFIKMQQKIQQNFLSTNVFLFIKYIGNFETLNLLFACYCFKISETFNI
jgi:hypothetical protein